MDKNDISVKACEILDDAINEITELIEETGLIMECHDSDFTSIVEKFFQLEFTRAIHDKWLIKTHRLEDLI